jgi:hypothetical protein
MTITSLNITRESFEAPKIIVEKSEKFLETKVVRNATTIDKNFQVIVETIDQLRNDISEKIEFSGVRQVQTVVSPQTVYKILKKEKVGFETLKSVWERIKDLPENQNKKNIPKHLR